MVEKIADVPVDDKSRPLQEVKIVHCGELELRKVPAKAPAPSTFEFDIALKWHSIERYDSSGQSLAVDIVQRRTWAREETTRPICLR